MTFNKRERNEDACDRVENTKEEIYFIAKKHGYSLTWEKIFEYDNMYFIMWEVRKVSRV